MYGISSIIYENYLQILHSTIAKMEEEREQLRTNIAQLNQQLIDKDEQVKVTYRKQSAMVRFS